MILVFDKVNFEMGFLFRSLSLSLSSSQLVTHFVKAFSWQEEFFLYWEEFLLITVTLK